MLTFKDIYKPMPVAADNDVDLEDIVFGFEGRGRDRDRLWSIPDYQRGRVWTDEQASAFCGHVLTGGSVPAMWLNRSETRKEIEIIDGQQRLTSLFRWIKGEIPATLLDGETQIWSKDFEDADWRYLCAKIMVKIKFVDLTRKEAIGLYLRLNTGGTPHTPEEIARVRALLAETP